MAQYVYTMHRVGKIVPPKREILKDISLSFFPGAKIGVLGLNGAGKSTLLRIMAGVDTEIEGEARPMPGINVGYLPQEPKLDPQATVRDIVEEAVGQIKQARRGWTRSMPPMPSRMPTSTPWPPSRPSWRRSSRHPTDTTWNANWKSPPTPCACRRGMPRSSTCPAAKSAA